MSIGVEYFFHFSKDNMHVSFIPVWKRNTSDSPVLG